MNFVVEVTHLQGSGTCPEGYRELLDKDYTSDYCYMVIIGDESESQKTWGESDLHCMIHGGQLTSIHSEEEMTAIADEVVGKFDIWIGLQKDSKYLFKNYMNYIARLTDTM